MKELNALQQYRKMGVDTATIGCDGRQQLMPLSRAALNMEMKGEIFEAQLLQIRLSSVPRRPEGSLSSIT
jgi:hypothetical protein